MNRILLATDGDFNVGIDDTEELKGFIERKREKGIFLSVLGFGQGNYRDELAQALAQNGNGVAAYIDTLHEARKVLVQEATLVAVHDRQGREAAGGVQPGHGGGIPARRLRDPRAQARGFQQRRRRCRRRGLGPYRHGDLRDHAGGLGRALVDESRVRARIAAAPNRRGSRNEYGFLKIRYKLPTESQSRLLQRPIPLDTGSISAALQREVQFSTAVAGFGQLLRGGTYTGTLSYEDVIRQAQGADRRGPLWLPRRVRAAGAQGASVAGQVTSRYFCVFTL